MYKIQKFVNVQFLKERELLQHIHMAIHLMLVCWLTMYIQSISASNSCNWFIFNQKYFRFLSTNQSGSSYLFWDGNAKSRHSMSTVYQLNMTILKVHPKRRKENSEQPYTSTWNSKFCSWGLYHKLNVQIRITWSTGRSNKNQKSAG